MTSVDPVDLLKRVPLMSPREHLTAEEVLQKEGADFSLKGKVILVTGGSAGLGVETVRAFASRGARVLVAVRDVEKTRPITDEIAKKHPNHGGLEIVRLDLESLDSVRAGAQEVLSKTQQLNVLVENAGVMNTPYKVTKDGHEYQFGVNHLGHFLLFKLLLPLLMKSSTPSFQSRVVILSSAGHRFGGVDLDDLHFQKRGYTGFKSYGQAKTSNILMAREIEKRYGKQGVHAFAVHPGGIATELGRHTPFEDLVKMGLFNDKGEFVGTNKFKSTEQGAATSVWAAVAKELEGKGGEYLDNVQIGKAQDHAVDDDMAGKLWEYSEKTVGA